ncbi:HK97-gp10 family putative phage morphogenesis protein [Paracoccus aminophilus]|uniref:Phage protein, HK97 gp10 family n=1 Tax=Paracoccus aminophilus JCM 7686 TaxID=1367847 RepID=S5YCY0_PARAH|nr:HK97-gp10 family putative phage morphogenesis protein [Paracoccus aminophilus]AGT09318.1 hypothetical protein JCM7686_2241 [Paracoccus aminophilus JCM 7686]AGT10585.1 hypothetical protein JCM7686_2920 [Paracoccus aminophilus JCM 7686]
MARLNPRIVAKLKNIPAVAVEAAQKAMEEGAAEIVAAMKAAAPHDQGDLRDSIGWTWGEVPAGTFMIDEIRSGKNKGDQYATLRIKIYAGNADAFYARFHEFGTSTGVPAQPFFFPVWKARKAEFRKRIRKEVRAAIKEAWRNG